MRRESTKNTKKNRLEIEVEVSHGEFETRYIPMETTFTMATDTAFNVLTDLGKSAFAIYMVILKHRNMRTNKCFPSYSTINKESGCGLSNIKVTLNKLEEVGYLSINSGMRGIANNYYFPQEWFYAYFDDDINQRLAKRRDKVVTEKRETKVEKENKELKKENDELRKKLDEVNKHIEKMNKVKEEQDDLDEVDPF